MRESINSRVSEHILDILKKGPYTSAEMQNQIQLWDKELYHDIDRLVEQKGKKSPFSKCVDGALQNLKRQGKVEKVQSGRGSPWRLPK